MNRDSEDAALHDQAMRELYQQAEFALKAARSRPLNENEISLIGWCAHLDVRPNTEKKS